VSAAGIIVCIITSFFATHIMKVDEKKKIENTLKWQLLISTILLIPVLVILSLLLIPDQLNFIINEKEGTVFTVLKAPIKVMVCLLSGLVSGLIIGWFTDYFTSNAHGPTQALAVACKSGAAINIIHGLALGYLSCIIPILALGGTIYASFKLVGMYGISLAALGMLSNLAISLAIDAYGPISDNAGGISEMSGLDKKVREITDALDAAGNTTAAIGKGFAIGSACLVGIALFGAFVARTQVLIL
jgi:Na+/H+-translocating membrane pyrophosphatase